MSIIIANQDLLKNKVVKAIKDGMEISSGAKSTSTYYHTKDQQIQAIKTAISGLYDVDKSLPILLACMDDSTNFFRQEVVKNEFKRGFDRGTMSIVKQDIWLKDRLQEKMISHIVSSLPVTYALRLFIGMRDEKINNPRSRRVLISWIFSNMNDFSVVKYRTKMRRALEHAYHKRGWSSIVTNLVKYLNDQSHDSNILNKFVFSLSDKDNTYLAKLILFVAGKGKREWYKSGFDHIKSYYDAAHAKSETDFLKHAQKLDFTVCMGLISSYPNELFKTFVQEKKLKDSIKAALLKESQTLTDDQKVRTKALQEKVGGKARTDIDFKKVQTESIYKTDGIDDQKQVRAEADKIALPYTSIGIIVDNSLSNRGGKDSQNTPAVVIEHLTNVLKKSCTNSFVVHTSLNQTDLSKPFIEIIKYNPDVECIFVLSDGYENFPYEGCLNDLVAKWNKTHNVQVIHCSPYGSAEMLGKSRDLGSEIISMAITKPQQIQTQMNARLLDFNPIKYFEDNFSRFLTLSQRIHSRVEEEFV